MKNKTLLYGAIITVFIIIFYLVFSTLREIKKPSSPILIDKTNPVVNTPANPSFDWSYSTTSKNEIPNTIISLTATYSNGALITKTIDTIQGGCNEYENRDVDVYSSSTMIICYYAGLGHYFKIVKSGSSFLVQRKVFEEASPEYNPPVRAFETIVTF